MKILSGQKGFTLTEIIVASLILTFLIAAALQYHASSKGSKGQKYYLKAVQVAHTELNRLRALYDMDPDAEEFKHTGAPSDFLYTQDASGDVITLPTGSVPTHHVYYSDHGFGGEMFRPLRQDSGNPPYAVDGPCSGVSKYHDCYENEFTWAKTNLSGNTDWRTFVYYVSDTNPAYPPDCDTATGHLDASIVVIDDMGSPEDPADDLLGGIGWWIQDETVSGITVFKRVCFILGFWYPGESRGHKPEIISLKTTLVPP